MSAGFFLTLEGGEGAEVPGQLCEQLALVSAAAEEASEELRLLPYSGQTAAPASGARRSTVLLDVARTSGFDRVLVLEPGQLFEEVAVEATPAGAALVEAASTEAAVRGHRRLLLDVREANEVARAHYRRMGFIETDERTADPAHGRCELSMVRELP